MSQRGTTRGCKAVYFTFSPYAGLKEDDEDNCDRGQVQILMPYVLDDRSVLDHQEGSHGFPSLCPYPAPLSATFTWLTR
ncbi:hypothetical protein ACFX13_042064 [Malus domestica]